MQAVTTIGLDIAKSVFQVHGVDAAGQVLIRRQFALDRAKSLSAAIAEDGQTIRTRTSVRVHPGLRDETREPGAGRSPVEQARDQRRAGEVGRVAPHRR